MKGLLWDCLEKWTNVTQWNNDLEIDFAENVKKALSICIYMQFDSEIKTEIKTEEY